MRGLVAICKRELLSFFVTPLAWVLFVVFLVAQGLHFQLVIEHFAQNGLLSDQTPLQAFFGNTVFFYMVLFLFVPALTMRAFAEERARGTLEALVTSPVTTTEIVVAKYLAVLLTYAAMWVPTLLYVVVLGRSGSIDFGATASAYAGALLVGATYLAVGILMSSLTSSQLVALSLSGLVLLGLFLVGLVGESFAKDGTALHDVAVHVSAWATMNDFAAGIVDTRRVVFAASLILVSLYGAVRSVEAARWS